MADDCFYKFLDDEYFEGSRWTRKGFIASNLQSWSPHKIWNSPVGTFSNSLRGCGKKSEAVIRQILQEYKKYCAFCECGEPYLSFYNFCPICGKRG